jgi:hypothetical protein
MNLSESYKQRISELAGINECKGGLLCEPHKQRFSRAIYLYYVSHHMDGNYKHTTKNNFYQRLLKIKDKSKVVEFDKTNRHRLADTKEIWYDKHNRVLGEIWTEHYDYGIDKDDTVTSYWINLENKNIWKF